MKQRVPSFDEFINESNESEINEAFKPGRAWSGGTANIDKLFSWLYDKDILNKGDKNKKDSIFWQYYRYYNDGDIPRGLPRRFSKEELRFSKESRNALETMLEIKLEDYIKSILSKYRGKFDRQEFRYDTALSDYNTLKNVINDNNFHSVLNYWGKEIKINDSEFEKLLAVSQKQYDKLKTAVNAKIDEFPDAPGSWDDPIRKGMTVNYTKEVLEDVGLWDDKLEKLYKEIDATFRSMEEIVDGVIKATQLAKESFLSSK